MPTPKKRFLAELEIDTALPHAERCSLARLLKRLGRSFDVRCLGVVEVIPDGPAVPGRNPPRRPAN